MQSFINKFRASANRAAMVQSRIKAMNRMECVAEILEDPSLRFAFPPPEPISSPVLQVVDVAFSYPGKPALFSRVNLGLDMSSRVALVGPNGIGKSTLLKARDTGRHGEIWGDTGRYGASRRCSRPQPCAARSSRAARPWVIGGDLETLPRHLLDNP